MWLRFTDPQVASIIFYYLGGLTVRDMRHLLDLLAPTEQVYHPPSQDNLKCGYPRAFQLRKRQRMLLSTEKYSISMLASLPFPYGYNDQVSKRKPGLLLRSIDSAFQSLENQETEKTGLPVLTTASANGAAGTPSFLVAYKIYARLRE